MPAHEKKVCPRCHQIFECKVGNILECQCSQIYLTQEEQDYIANLNFEACLCLDCLKQLQSQCAR